jgi:GTPase SAR1 family protein
VNFRDSQIRLQIWDSAGQEKYRSLIPAYLKGSSIIFLVYDIASNSLLNIGKETFTNLKKWLSFINENKSENTILVLCGNKSDLER